MTSKAQKPTIKDCIAKFKELFGDCFFEESSPDTFIIAQRSYEDSRTFSYISMIDFAVLLQSTDFKVKLGLYQGTIYDEDTQDPTCLIFGFEIRKNLCQS